MRRDIWITALMLLGAVALSSEALAQQQMPEPHGRLVVYGTTAKTILRAPALSGSPEFTNNGSYWGINGEIEAGKLDIYALYQSGKAKVIPGGTMFPPAPTFQPLTGERSDVIDVAVGYTVFNSETFGKVQPFVGYYRLWAEPMISPANWYQGAQLGVKGRRDWQNGLAVFYKVGYVPHYTVNGYVHKSLAQDDMWLFRVGGEVPVYKNKFFLTGGYQLMRLEAVATANHSAAVVKFGGLFAGGGYRF